MEKKLLLRPRVYSFIKGLQRTFDVAGVAGVHGWLSACLPPSQQKQKEI